ncbi:MAG: hypothetical protein WDN49_24190 [Acetobacteraceae bacterium]
MDSPISGNTYLIVGVSHIGSHENGQRLETAANEMRLFDNDPRLGHS